MPDTTALDILQRKFSMHKCQLQLEVQFNKNMELFKTIAPAIYQEYIDYTPEELRLSFSSEGYLELVNYKLNNKPVYAKDPAAFIEDQLKHYEQKPNLTNISFTKTKEADDEHFHVSIINRLLDEYKALNVNKSYHLNVPIGFMIVTGCGLGYHLQSLVEKYDIHNLCIFDPHKDSFYACLHTIDWTPIIRNFYQTGRMLKLYIGMSTFKALADLKLLTDKIGLHNLVYTYVYRHFSSKKEEEFIEKYKKEFHLQASGIGFFEDEQISMAHTVSHLNKKVKLLAPHANTAINRPVFVVGNGPSLDKCIDLIRQAQNDAVIFSCGTALGALCKAGITPDFHIEMERRRTVREWIETGSTAEFRRNIHVLALNTTSPEVIDLFPRAAIAKKPNDLGEFIINKEVTNHEVPALPLCNPTVTNTGLAYAIYMGFTEIYLLGVDLGMTDADQHHSKYSVYTDLEKTASPDNVSHLTDRKKHYQIKGNHQEFVISNAHLDQSRINMEILLAHFPYVNCYNPNDGALIEGTKSIYLDDITIQPVSDNKSTLLDQVMADKFITPECRSIDETYFNESHLSGFFAFKGDLSLPKKVKDIYQLHKRINSIYLKVKNKKDTDPISTLLLRGSLSSYFTLIINNCLFCNNKQEFDKAYTLGRNAYMEFIDEAYRYLEREPLRLDNTQDSAFS